MTVISISIHSILRLIERDELDAGKNQFYLNIKKIVKRDEIFPVVIINTDNGYDLSYSKIKNESKI